METLIQERNKPVHEQAAQASELEIIMTAAQVQESVRRTVTFSPYSRIDDLRTTDTANCVGYAKLGSVGLEDRGVRHYVGFVNGHATLLIPTPDNMWLFDMLSPRLSQPMGRELLNRQPTRTERSLALMSGRGIVLNGAVDPIGATQKYPWLSTERGSHRINHPDSEYSAGSRNLILSMYQPEPGRKAIYHYAKFNEAYEDKNLIEAAESLKQMHGLFPDIDMRGTSPQRVKSTVKRLAIARNFDLAREAAEAYFASFTHSTDSRVAEYQADCLRYIAKFSRQGNLAKRAIELYESTKRNPKSHRSSIKAKIDLCAPLTEGNF